MHEKQPVCSLCQFPNQYVIFIYSSLVEGPSCQPSWNITGYSEDAGDT